MHKLLISTLLSIFLMTSPVLAETTDEPAGSTKEGNFLSLEERRLHDALNKERALFEKHMAEKEDDLNNQAVALNLLKKEVETKIKEMETLKKEVTGLFSERNEELDKRSVELGKMYAKMEPEEAALIMTKLNKKLAISILLNMKEKSAGPILAVMNSKTASKLSTSYSTLVERQNSLKGKR